MVADMTAVPPEAYEAAMLALHEVECGGVDCTPMHLMSHRRPARAVVEAAAPIMRSLGVAEGRRQAAEAIRAHIDGLRGGSGPGMNAMISDLDFAARIAEGDLNA